MIQIMINDDATNDGNLNEFRLLKNDEIVLVQNDKFGGLNPKARDNNGVGFINNAWDKIHGF